MLSTLKRQFDELEAWQKAAIIAGAVAGVGGAAYLLTRPSTSAANDKPDSSKPAKNTQKAAAQQPAPTSTTGAAAQPAPSAVNETAAAKRQANLFKKDGNSAYKNKQFREAIAAYTKALATIPSGDKEAAVYHCNRAAAHLMMGSHQKVVEDCSAALKIDPRYIKALNRRAQAKEALKQFRGAMQDYTAVLYIDKFQNAAAQQALERLMQLVISQEMTTILAKPRTSLPAITTLLTHFESYGGPDEEAEAPDALAEQLTDKNTDPVVRLRYANALMHARKYAEASTEYTRAADKIRELELTAERKEQLYKCLCMQASFDLLKGDFVNAKAKLDEAIRQNVAEPVLALIRRGTCNLEMRDFEGSMRDLQQATKSGHPLAYVARGQAYLMMQRTAEGLADFEKAVTLKPTSYIPYIHLALSKLQSDRSRATQVLDEAIAQFPESSVLYQFRGEILMNFGELDAAEKAYDKALKLDATNPNAYVNKGVLLIQKGKMSEGKQLMLKALDIDSACEAAYARLGELAVQKQDFKEALQLYDQAIASATVPQEIQTLLQQKEACLAQQYMAANYPELVAQLPTL
eukprot:TRINITY_DN6101_c0_g1_i4.p1 TRINITY_DN6101_c0_g1~~TRINITY_DN6101_c0_g1_i4.p1  ORF type:complete len:577 (+),score=174.64 TRINITY_DN6101_c0_g1_i4:56-1786(+)